MGRGRSTPPCRPHQATPLRRADPCSPKRTPSHRAARGLKPPANGGAAVGADSLRSRVPRGPRAVPPTNPGNAPDPGNGSVPGNARNARYGQGSGWKPFHAPTSTPYRTWTARTRSATNRPGRPSRTNSRRRPSTTDSHAASASVRSANLTDRTTPWSVTTNQPGLTAHDNRRIGRHGQLPRARLDPAPTVRPHTRPRTVVRSIGCPQVPRSSSRRQRAHRQTPLVRAAIRAANRTGRGSHASRPLHPV